MSNYAHDSDDEPDDEDDAEEEEVGRSSNVDSCNYFLASFYSIFKYEMQYSHHNIFQGNWYLVEMICSHKKVTDLSSTCQNEICIRKGKL